MSDLSEIEQLKLKLAAAESCLEEIINGCCNPEVALRRVMLDLKPIRKCLRVIRGEKSVDSAADSSIVNP